MNKAQKQLVTNLAGTAIVIAAFILGFGNFKDYINKSEAIRAFNDLGRKVMDFHKQNGQLPSETMIASLKEQLEGAARIGEIGYRAQWIGIDSPPETIVAYAEKKYNWLIESGFVVLRLDGQVQYLTPTEFHKLLTQQQTKVETEEMNKTQKKSNLGF
jgi:hypothetical protein